MEVPEEIMHLIGSRQDEYLIWLRTNSERVLSGEKPLPRLAWDTDNKIPTYGDVVRK